MISTVTTTTVTTVTMVMGLGAALGVVGVITLIAFLATKELATAANGPRHKFLARCLNVGIVPLAMVFATIVAFKVAQILG